MQDNSYFVSVDTEFVKETIKVNKEAFSKYSEHMSETNVQSLSIGYLAVWISECYMDF